MKYHSGPKNLCLDLGCGHGVVTRELSPYFTRVIGADPSPGMVDTAKANTPNSQYPNIEYHTAAAEKLPFISKAGSVDMVVAGQAAHWFQQAPFFAELDRVMRPGGTLAFWGYKDHVFVDYPAATDILNDYAYDLSPEKLGSYWPKGREIVQNKLRDIRPDAFEGWSQVERVEYEPGTEGKGSGEGTLFMHQRGSVGQCKSYMRTWSSYHGWCEAHEGRKPRSSDNAEGDVVDEIFDVIAKKVPDFANEEFEIEIEWGSGLVMARKE